jgi:Fe(3+) dicitrate transport protein
MRTFLLHYLLLSVPGILIAQTTQPTDSLRKRDMPHIEVIGSADRISQIPGSAKLVRSDQIRRIKPISGNEIVRFVPGVHVVDEEGLGLRANIGFRGLDPDRSRTVLLLEDGVPIALAPYGEPESYYSPTIDRISGIEVIKGSSSILFGPQTFGGVVNYLTANPPAETEWNATLRGGQNSFFVGQLGYGTSVGNMGIRANYLRKSGKGVGLIDYGIHDLNGKINLRLSDSSVLGLKLGLYDENSNATYVGLTQAMYDSGKHDFEQLAPDDRMQVRRYSASATHHYFFSDKLQLKSTAFAYTTTRDWARQNFTINPSPTVNYIRVVGDNNVPGGALYFPDQMVSRNRAFEVYGFESSITLKRASKGLSHDFQLGARYLHELASEQQIEGTTQRITTGVLRNDELRSGQAISVFAHNRMMIGDRFGINPGLRIEQFWFDRDILLLNRQITSTKKSDAITEIIPGFGITYDLSSSSELFAGIHRGFGPPRVKDAINNSGVSEELDAERSWNTELGLRKRLSAQLNADLVLYMLDFTNQIIPVSESSGGAGQSGVSGLVNGGETMHQGVEVSLNGAHPGLMGSQWYLTWALNSSLSRSWFSSDRFVVSGGKQVNIKDNTLPYAPAFLLNSSLAVGLKNRVEWNIHTTSVSKQYGDLLNQKEGSLNGQNGEIPSYLVIDTGISFSIPGPVKAIVSANIKNVLDQRYMVSRRPQGIRVGLPRFFTIGLDVRL